MSRGFVAGVVVGRGWAGRARGTVVVAAGTRRTESVGAADIAEGACASEGAGDADGEGKGEDEASVAGDGAGAAATDAVVAEAGDAAGVRVSSRPDDRVLAKSHAAPPSARIATAAPDHASRASPERRVLPSLPALTTDGAAVPKSAPAVLAIGDDRPVTLGPVTSGAGDCAAMSRWRTSCPRGDANGPSAVASSTTLA